jgi:hypothetical protein
MTKIVINECYGGFSLSAQALNEFCIRKGLNEIRSYEIARDDNDLIDIVMALGQKSWGTHAALKIVQIPDDVIWQIEEYDGKEWVAEQHRKWS